MMSKRGDVPWILIALIIGIIFLLTVFIIPGKKIPQSFEDFQSIERDITQQIDSLLHANQTRPRTVEDTAFLKIYSAFIDSMEACMRSPVSTCACELPLPTSFPPYYHIFLGYNPRAGYYSYAYVLRENQRIFLDEHFLFENLRVSPKGYNFRVDVWHVYPTTQVDISATEDGHLQFLMPPKDVPAFYTRKGILRDKKEHLFTYDLANEVVLFIKLPPGELRFLPAYSFYPSFYTEAFNLPFCVEPQE